MNNWKKHSEFFNQSDISIPASSTVEIMSQKLRNNLSLKITAFENYVGSVTAWGNLTWQLCCNGTPIDPFTEQKSQLGQQGIPQDITMDFIFPPASVISVKCINSDSSNAYVGGTVLKGEYGTEY